MRGATTFGCPHETGCSGNSSSSNAMACTTKATRVAWVATIRLELDAEELAMRLAALQAQADEPEAQVEEWPGSKRDECTAQAPRPEADASAILQEDVARGAGQLV